MADKSTVVVKLTPIQAQTAIEYLDADLVGMDGSLSEHRSVAAIILKLKKAVEAEGTGIQKQEGP